MKKNTMIGMATLCLSICLFGCNRETTAVQGTEIESSVEETETTELIEEKMEEISFFPETYSEQIDKVKFDCQLEVPEEFHVSDFHAPIIKGEAVIDSAKVYEKYVEGKNISEEYHDPAGSGNEWGADTYILDDQTLIGANGGFIYYKPEAALYINFARDSEIGAMQENFEFGTGEECIEQVKNELEEINVPVADFTFHWFSTSGSEYSEIEQEKLDNGWTDYEHTNQDGWSDENNAYEIYGWQTYEGLPVFTQVMTSAMKRAFENYQKAPVSARYTKQGIISMSVTYPPYIMDTSDEQLEFLPFSEIANAVVQRYSDLLDDCTYTVTRAKLAVRTYYDKNDELAAEPVWYFEVESNNSEEVLLFNAVTGQEIFMN